MSASATTGAIEQPVQVARVERVDQVVEAGRAAALEPGHEVDDPDRRERVARLGDDRRRQVDGREAVGRGAQPEVAGGGDGSVGHAGDPSSGLGDSPDHSTGARTRPMGHSVRRARGPPALARAARPGRE